MVYDLIPRKLPQMMRLHVLHTMPAEEKQQLKQSLGAAARRSRGEPPHFLRVFFF
jgi:hypothetical protein